MVEIFELLKIAVGDGAFSDQAMEATTRLMRQIPAALPSPGMF
jgi:hypothetical protein